MVILHILFHTVDSRQASEVSKTLSRVNKLKLCIYLEHNNVAIALGPFIYSFEKDFSTAANWRFWCGLF